MGVNKSFFNDDVRVPCTLRQFQNDNGAAVIVEHKTEFVLRRQTQAEADSFAREALLGQKSERELRLTRLSRLLKEAPAGFDDFPADERQLSERAYEYFDDEQMDSVVKTVLLLYDKAAYPAELFRVL